MNNIVFVNFECNENTKVVAQKIWQYDYGQILRIQGLNLPAAVEIHFSLQKTGGIAERRIGVTRDGVTDVVIPDFILKGEGIERNYSAYAFIYLSDEESGQTEHRIELNITSRPEPEGSTGSDETSFGAIMDAVNKIAEQNGQGVSDEKIQEAVNAYMEANPVEGNVTVDTELSETSTNPVQNKVVAAKFSQLSDLKENGTGTGTAVSSVEPMDDDIPKVFFVGTAPTSKGQDELPLTMEYRSKTKTIKSYVTLKVQGDSSASYPKKNFNIKMFSDEARTEKLKCTFRNWSNTHKFCLKANWIDHTHARNVVNGRLWGQVVKSRADYESYPTEYKESANSGAVDGFLIKVYINGVYQGIYTWNIRKDGSMFNMDDETGIHSALIADGVNTVTAWRELPTIGNGDWTDELNDTVPDAVKTSFQNAYSFVMNSTDEEFVANIEQHFYLSSLIDYFIFIYSILMFGGLAKSQTMFTYDANKWLANIYDMDTTWALYWNGKSFVSTSMACPEGYEHTAGYNLLYERLVALFPDRIKERYAELRSTVLSDGNIINEFERFMDVIPLNLYAEDFAETTANGAFTEIPSKDTNNLQKLRDIIVKRMAYCDEQIPLIGSTVEKIPATGITLSSTTLTFTDSTSQTLKATLEPSNTTDKVVWSSNNGTVATVTNGVIKPISNGSATITATAGSVSATCEVIVDVEEIVTLTSISATYTGGEVTAGTALTDLTGITVTATYSNGSTEEVTGYTLSGTIGVGANTITVSYEDKTTTFIVIGTEIDYGEALHPLVNGSNQSQTGILTAEVTNGNHVKLVNATENAATSMYVNFTNILANVLGKAETINNQEKVFSLSEGDVVVCTISGDNIPKVATFGWRIANTSNGISELNPTKAGSGHSKEATCTADYDIGSMFFFGNVEANTTYEFDVSLIVNNQRYI